MLKITETSKLLTVKHSEWYHKLLWKLQKWNPSWLVCHRLFARKIWFKKTLKCLWILAACFSNRSAIILHWKVYFSTCFHGLAFRHTRHFFKVHKVLGQPIKIPEEIMTSCVLHWSWNKKIEISNWYNYKKVHWTCGWCLSLTHLSVGFRTDFITRTGDSKGNWSITQLCYDQNIYNSTSWYCTLNLNCLDYVI